MILWSKRTGFFGKLLIFRARECILVVWIGGRWGTLLVGSVDWIGLEALYNGVGYDDNYARDTRACLRRRDGVLASWHKPVI